MEGDGGGESAFVKYIWGLVTKPLSGPRLRFCWFLASSQLGTLLSAFCWEDTLCNKNLICAVHEYSIWSTWIGQTCKWRNDKCWQFVKRFLSSWTPTLQYLKHQQLQRFVLFAFLIYCSAQLFKYLVHLYHLFTSLHCYIDTVRLQIVHMLSSLMPLVIVLQNISLLILFFC